jgi:hypothetical protein
MFAKQTETLNINLFVLIYFCCQKFELELGIVEHLIGEKQIIKKVKDAKQDWGL